MNPESLSLELEEEPGISSLLVGCSSLAATATFLRDILGLTAGEIRVAPPNLPGNIHPIRFEQCFNAPADCSITTALHLVEFENPGKPLRLNAGPHDACAKTINFLCENLHEVYPRLEAAGITPRSPLVEYTKNGTTYRDAHFSGPDAMNIGLLEILGENYLVNRQGVGPIAAVCFTQPRMTYAGRLAAALALPLVFDETLSGEAIERMLFLPRGGALDMRLFGSTQPRGRLELVSYRGASGTNLHPETRPPATGLLHPRFRVKRLEEALSRGEKMGLSVSPISHGVLLGQGVLSATIETPDGFLVELVSRTQPSSSE